MAKNKLYNLTKIACNIFGHLVKCTHGVLEEKKTVWKTALNGIGDFDRKPVNCIIRRNAL
jgi:hypothetical protein